MPSFYLCFFSYSEDVHQEEGDRDWDLSVPHAEREHIRFRGLCLLHEEGCLDEHARVDDIDWKVDLRESGLGYACPPRAGSNAGHVDS